MANTYTQLYIQIVFAVKGRQQLIPQVHKAEIYKYITGVIQQRKHKLLATTSLLPTKNAYKAESTKELQTPFS